MRSLLIGCGISRASAVALGLEAALRMPGGSDRANRRRFVSRSLRSPYMLAACLLFLSFGVFPSAKGQTAHPQPKPAQPNPAFADEVPPTGDPEVAYMFLLHHRGLAEEIRGMEASKPGVAADSKKAAAASMHLSISDFDAVGTVYSQVATLLQAVDKDADRYRDSVVSGAVSLDVNVLRQFDARNTRIKATIRQRLQAALSPDGWTALNAYIEGEFRQGVHKVRRPQ